MAVRKSIAILSGWLLLACASAASVSTEHQTESWQSRLYLGQKYAIKHVSKAMMENLQIAAKLAPDCLYETKVFETAFRICGVTGSDIACQFLSVAIPEYCYDRQRADIARNFAAWKSHVANAQANAQNFEWEKMHENIAAAQVGFGDCSTETNMLAEAFQLCFGEKKPGAQESCPLARALVPDRCMRLVGGKTEAH